MSFLNRHLIPVVFLSTTARRCASSAFIPEPFVAEIDTLWHGFVVYVVTVHLDAKQSAFIGVHASVKAFCTTRVTPLNIGTYLEH